MPGAGALAFLGGMGSAVSQQAGGLASQIVGQRQEEHQYGMEETRRKQKRADRQPFYSALAELTTFLADPNKVPTPEDVARLRTALENAPDEESANTALSAMTLLGNREGTRQERNLDRAARADEAKKAAERERLKQEDLQKQQWELAAMNQRGAEKLTSMTRPAPSDVDEQRKLTIWASTYNANISQGREPDEALVAADAAVPGIRGVARPTGLNPARLAEEVATIKSHLRGLPLRDAWQQLTDSPMPGSPLLQQARQQVLTDLSAGLERGDTTFGAGEKTTSQTYLEQAQQLVKAEWDRLYPGESMLVLPPSAVVRGRANMGALADIGRRKRAIVDSIISGTTDPQLITALRMVVRGNR